jgi:hypothetical protein
MKVREFTVRHCAIQDIRDFVEHWHYSSSVNGLMVSYCFALYHEDTLIGGMIYGGLGMANAWKKYADNPKDVIELRRLCCIDDTPKNTESFFIGYTLRWLKKNTGIKTVVSYSDTHYGHEGIIYKASNFKMIGKTAKSKVIIFGDRQYHDKAIRTYHTYKDGTKRLKPFAQRIKDALEDGRAHYEARTPKNIYTYEVKGKG